MSSRATSPRPALIAAGLATGLALTLSACSVSSGDGNAEGGPPVRLETQDAQTVSSYFSIYAYGPTKVMHRVPGEKAALLLEFPNQSKTLSASGKLILFGENASEEKIQAWWNNQYSDAIFPDAAAPEKTVMLGQRLEIVSSTMTGTERPRPDQSYDTYDVTYRVTDVATERFTLQGFTAKTKVHVMMEGKRP